MAIKYFHGTEKWSINWMCKQLKVSRSAYYKWLYREIPEQELENIKLAEIIKEYDERFNHILGYRRMTSWINHFNHTKYSQKRIHRIMKKLGIHSVIRKKKKKYLLATPEAVAENKLDRDFYATAPNEKWATDVTEFKIPGGNKKLYLSAILDLYDRYPVALLVLEMIINWYLRPLTKPLRLTQMSNHYSIVIEVFSIPASFFKRNLRNMIWCNPCHELVIVLTMVLPKDSGVS